MTSPNIDLDEVLSDWAATPRMIPLDGLPPVVDAADPHPEDNSQSDMDLTTPTDQSLSTYFEDVVNLSDDADDAVTGVSVSQSLAEQDYLASLCRHLEVAMPVNSGSNDHTFEHIAIPAATTSPTRESGLESNYDHDNTSYVQSDKDYNPDHASEDGGDRFFAEQWASIRPVATRLPRRITSAMPRSAHSPLGTGDASVRKTRSASRPRRPPTSRRNTTDTGRGSSTVRSSQTLHATQEEVGASATTDADTATEWIAYEYGTEVYGQGPSSSSGLHGTLHLPQHPLLRCIREAASRRATEETLGRNIMTPENWARLARGVNYEQNGDREWVELP